MQVHSDATTDRIAGGNGGSGGGGGGGVDSYRTPSTPGTPNTPPPLSNSSQGGEAAAAAAAAEVAQAERIARLRSYIGEGAHHRQRLATFGSVCLDDIVSSDATGHLPCSATGVSRVYMRICSEVYQDGAVYGTLCVSLSVACAYVHCVSWPR